MPCLGREGHDPLGNRAVVVYEQQAQGRTRRELAPAGGAQRHQRDPTVRNRALVRLELPLRGKRQGTEAGTENVRQGTRRIDGGHRAPRHVDAKLKGTLFSPGAGLAHKIIGRRRIRSECAEPGAHLVGIELTLVVEADQPLARDRRLAGLEVEILGQFEVCELLGTQAFLHIGVARHPPRQARRSA